MSPGPPGGRAVGWWLGLPPWRVMGLCPVMFAGTAPDEAAHAQLLGGAVAGTDAVAGAGAVVLVAMVGLRLTCSRAEQGV